jgi:hypothetical protein
MDHWGKPGGDEREEIVAIAATQISRPAPPFERSSHGLLT